MLKKRRVIVVPLVCLFLWAQLAFAIGEGGIQGGSGTTNASDLSSGTLPAARIGDNSVTAAKLKADSGTPGATTYFRGDNTWQTPSGVPADNSLGNVKIASDAGIDVTKVGPGTVDNTEFGYLNGVTSAIQTQLDGKLGTTGSIAGLTGDYGANIIPTAKGGFGINLSSWGTCFNWFNGGTPTCDNAATMRTNLGLGASDTPTFAGLNLTGPLTVNTADNTHYGDYTNTGDLDAVYQAIGRAWYNSGSKLWKFRNFDNSATSEFFTSEGTNTGNFETSGTLRGKVSVLDNTASPTASQVYGTIIMVAGASTVTLPTAVSGMSVCVVDNAATASDIIVDVQAGDNVVLVGVTQAGGVGITNASGSSLGDYVCLFSPVANRWMVLGKQGTWASQ